VALSKLGRLDQALTQMQEGLRLAPNDPLYSQSIGLLMARWAGTRSPRRPPARRHPRPGQSRFWYNLGLAESHLGNTDAALSDLHKAEQLDPAIADYPYARATIYLGLNQPDQAKAALQQVLRIDPNHQAARQLANQL